MASETAQLFVGIDGGGSGCRVAIADATGLILGEGEAGPANATSDLEGALTNIRQALVEAADAAGLTPETLAQSRCHAGLAGLLTEDQANAILDALPMPATASEDKETQIAGALGDRDGIVLAVGTGSLIGWSQKGQMGCIGGWGLQLSDEASGAWLGRELLAETLRCHDGLSTPSGLTRAAFEHFDENPNAIVAFAATARPANFAKLAPDVVKAAEASDPLALNLMQRGASYLTRAIDTIGLSSDDVLCLTGGLGPIYAPWLTPFHRARIAEPIGSAIDGALILAQRHHSAT